MFTKTKKTTKNARIATPAKVITLKDLESVIGGIDAGGSEMADA